MKKNILDQIKYPSDLRKLKEKDLNQLSKELRKELIASRVFGAIRNDLISTTFFR